MIARRLLVAAIALLLAAQVVRNAAVATLAPLHPDKAARLWRAHPEVRLSSGAIAIAAASHDRRPIDPSMLGRIYAAAAQAPLSAQPFLVRGVQAELAGENALAQRAFMAAQARDPRSLAAAYFLAGLYLQTGRTDAGIQEISAVSRLAPDGPTAVAPYLAAYAKNRSNWPAVRRLFESDRHLQALTLAELARDPANTESVMALARGMPAGDNAQWLSPLLGSLVAAGQYGRAKAIWAAVSKARITPGTLLYDADFKDNAAPPPFNWSLKSSTLGLAERQSGGRLHVLYYGQQEGVLASQLLLLAPGTYHLTAQLLGGGERAGALSWGVRCDKAVEAFSSIALDAAAAHGWTFTVPAGCQAQWLELDGHTADVAQQSDVTLSALRLDRGGPGA
jgi:hypothetical protein